MRVPVRVSLRTAGSALHRGTGRCVGARRRGTGRARERERLDSPAGTAGGRGGGRGGGGRGAPCYAVSGGSPNRLYRASHPSAV